MCRKSSDAERVDPVFESDQSIGSMVAEFEACRWPFAQWSHRCHLAVGAWYLVHDTHDVALSRIRERIQNYNRLCGPGIGYNETITQLYMRLLHARIRQGQQPLVAIVNELARTHPMSWVREHYSQQRLSSDAARRGWVKPDLKPLDDFR